MEGQCSFFEQYNIFPHLLELNDKYCQSFFALCTDGLSQEQAILLVRGQLFEALCQCRQKYLSWEKNHFDISPPWNQTSCHTCCGSTCGLNSGPMLNKSWRTEDFSQDLLYNQKASVKWPIQAVAMAEGKECDIEMQIYVSILPLTWANFSHGIVRNKWEHVWHIVQAYVHPHWFFPTSTFPSGSRWRKS